MTDSVRGEGGLHPCRFGTWETATLRAMTSSTPIGPTPQVRPAVRDLPAYVPGRPPAPRPGVTTYKLSSNENPNDPLPGVLEAAVEAAGRMNRYPDMGCTALYEALAARLDVPATHLAAGTGSVAVLYHLLQAFCEPGDEVVYAWRSFEAYPIAVAVPGAVVRAGAPDPGRPARPRRDGRRRHRPHQGRDRVQPQQPDRPRRASCGARGVPRPGPLARGGGARRGLPRVRPRRGPVRRRRGLPLAPQRGRDADLRQGLRPGRVPGRLRRRSPGDRRPRSGPARCRSVSRRSPRRRRSPPWSGRPSCSSGWTASSSSGPG